MSVDVRKYRDKVDVLNSITDNLQYRIIKTKVVIEKSANNHKFYEIMGEFLQEVIKISYSITIMHFKKCITQ